MSTASAAPVRSLTGTSPENVSVPVTGGGTARDAHGTDRRFSLSRAALIFVAVLVATRTPLTESLISTGSTSLALPLSLGIVWGAMSFALARRLRGERNDARRETWAGISLVFDVVGLSALLSQAGAAQHPFTLLYFVPITLATVVAPRWTVRIAVLSVLCFALLVAQTALALAEHRNHGHHAHFFQHVQGMAVALGVVGAFVTLSVQGIARALSAQRRRIEELSREQQQNQFAVSLGALSAGAAHELGTPLGTVQLLVEELPHLEEKEKAEALKTIVDEVQRMKSILHGMNSSELSAEMLSDTSVWNLNALCPLVREQGARCESEFSVETTQPRRVLEQILRELIRNALRSRIEADVRVSVTVSPDGFTLSVADNGPGLSSEQLTRALQPFSSGTGGTGLGLFLAGVHARQLGGRLELQSVLGNGTTAGLFLPFSPKVSAGAADG